MSHGITWPDGHRFAFTIFDDTDRSTLENTRPVYDLLAELGFRTSKSVWPITGPEEPMIPGTTCDDDAYREWTLELQAAGFEIGFHNATFHGSDRNMTKRGLDRFREIYGHDPFTAANHASNDEAIYWGRHRLTGPNAWLYAGLRRFKDHNRFRGHIEGDPLFWGDLCKERITYLRNFVFGDINTLNPCPMMPYRDPTRPYVHRWFASAEGADVDDFVRTISEQNQDQLEREGGLCIMYTHFGKGFAENGKVHPRFAALMKRLSEKGGWYVPTNVVLDHIEAVRGPHVITPEERSALERRWLRHKIVPQQAG